MPKWIIRNELNTVGLTIQIKVLIIIAALFSSGERNISRW